MLTVICIYWEGDFRGRDFTPDDVERLRLSVDKHIDRPYTFYCLTNAVERIKSLDHVQPIELKHNWPGWWAKMELHRPDLPAGRTLYMDLDSHIVSSLSPILDYPGNLVMFGSDRFRQVQKTDIGLVKHHYQAATMLFTAGAMKNIYIRFCQAPERFMERYRSDQDIMAEWLPRQPLFPKQWMMKLKRCKDLIEAPNENVIIITGQPGDGSFRDMSQYPWVEKEAHGK